MALFSAANHAATHLKHTLHGSLKPAHQYMKGHIRSKAKLIQKHLKLSSRRVRQGSIEERERESLFRFHPNKRFKIIWDMVLMIVILYSIVVIPYRLAAHVDAEGWWLAIETTFDVFFGLDLILNFFTSYFDPHTGELETRLGKIAKNII